MATPTLRARLADRGVSPRLVTMAVAALATFSLMLVTMLLPVPYAVQAPGPVIDTLGDVDGVELIHIEGTETYETSGALQLTTVTTAGGPGYPVDSGGVIRGWLSPTTTVAPVELFFDPGQSQDEIDQTSAQQMISSQQNATVAALTELGYDVPAELTVVGTQQGSGADGVAQDGDRIVGIVAGDEEVEVVTFADLADVLAATPPGSTVDLVVDRDGERVALPVVTGDDGRGGSVLGVFLDGEFDYPVDVRIQIENVGGPSAGTMFALGIIDMLTPGEMTGGHNVAGTGTVSLGGLVGAIGGIQQKMAGARAADAEYFLAPLANCGEVVGHVPAGLRVVAVSTLAEARAAVEAIGAGDTADLPTC
ncbi:MAG TPA: S16 family serine protease [Actinotalea caeni]|uniref:YlbL family protein n=1 Tax=Actinotalea caeni TaxID=1348467 RepID=UPI0012E2EADF|nr:S16 family serine protease [Actinotalea caeni]HLV54377.1 S16 family serine protease [Actinotalea caeni]